jgi:hypothetical protein
VHIVAYGNNEWVIISKPDWALLGGYIYELQAFVRAAGPCLKGNGSDVEKPGNGEVHW